MKKIIDILEIIWYRCIKNLLNPRWWKLYTFPHWYARIKYGVSERDSWELREHLDLVVKHGLPYIRNGRTHPFGLTPKEWEDILKYIEDNIDLDPYDILGIKYPNYTLFEIFKNHKKEYNALVRKKNRARKLLVKYWDDLWD